MWRLTTRTHPTTQTVAVGARRISPAIVTPSCWVCALQFSRAFSATANSTTSKDLLRLSRIRNLGIIAHIDAGKTTTAERVLFYARKTRVLGDVDRGDTVLDFMTEERERGITIQAACITLPWTRQGPEEDGVAHRINLIDTPGHVDFTQQVEQSLRVLDGAICVLDGVKGVQAQTICVWNQAAKYGVARLAFVNKMDRDGANFNRAVESIREKLHTTPLVLTLPLFSSTHASGGDGTRPSFIGIIDLVRMESWTWNVTDSASIVATANNLSVREDDGAKFDVRVLEKDHSSYSEALQARNTLLESLAEADDTFMESLLPFMDEEEAHLKVPVKTVKEALRRVVVRTKPTLPSTSLSTSVSTQSASQSHTLILCGSSKANKGVQPLLNAVLDFLPSPLDRPEVLVEQQQQIQPVGNSSTGGKGKKSGPATPSLVPSNQPQIALKHLGRDPSKEPLLALAFKVSHDLDRGAMPIVFVRVYAGAIRKGDSVLSCSPKGVGAASTATNGTVQQQETKLVAAGATAPDATNAASSQKERPQKLLELSADNMTLEIPQIESGNIGALVGLKYTRTGDTILPAITPANKQSPLVGIAAHEPVFFCSIEAGSLSAAKALDLALACLQREDPSLTVTTMEGQTVLAGQGELHLEIVKSRLEREFTLGASEGGDGITFGAMRISYREGLSEEQAQRFTHTPMDGSSGEVSLHVSLTPLPTHGSGISVSVDGPSGSTPNLLAAAESGVRDGLARGPLLGYAVTDVSVHVSDVTFIGGVTPTICQSIRACAARAVSAVLRQAKDTGTAHLLEPVMSCSLSVHSSHVGSVLSDLTSKRRATILDVRQIVEGSSNQSAIDAEVPLVEMLGYANVLRSTTQGNGSFAMSIKEFQKVPQHLQSALIETPP